jgi:tRNA nucleotidyltransferase (CCA-adding enzyme)
MQTYLVGGAVRDALLKLPVKERDHVVVGATVQQMLDDGFTPVGKDFPVFLHPETKEEYALARTERKSGKGYTGFECIADPTITLEQDLQRRDLTVNAMAQDEQGKLIDPYGGQQDLENRLLRHVSQAFVEDPLRVLRVARFAARLHGLGFRVADETRALMQTIADSGELTALVPERVWKEMSRALGEPHPDVFIQVLRDCGALKIILPEIDALFGVPQPPQHHPEIDTGEHCLQCLRQSVQLGADTETRFAVLVHDLGKASTPPQQWPKHIGHETASLPLIKNLGARLRVPKAFEQLALITAQYHTHCHRALELRPATIVKLFDGVDAWRKPQRFEHFLLACEADARGRGHLAEREYPQRAYLQQCLQAARAVEIKSLVERGLAGEALGQAITKARVDAVAAFIKKSD